MNRDPLIGPLQKARPVRRLNKLPLIILFAIVLVALTFMAISVGSMGGHRVNQDVQTKGHLSTEPFLDKWLADKPTGVIAEAQAEEPLSVISLEPTPQPVEVVEPELVVHAGPSEAEIKHREAVEQAMLGEAQRIFEDKMQRQQMAIRSLVKVAFDAKTGDSGGAAAQDASHHAVDPMLALSGIQEALLSRAQSGSSPAEGLPGVLGLGGHHNAEAWRHFDHKQGFLDAANTSENYLNQARTKAIGATEIKAGTTIPAVMITGANSDLPGQMLAQVASNVWDSIDGTHVLIPQGARLVGRYDSAVQYGQNRLLVVWDRVIYPDGSSLNLEGMQGQDKAGNSGFKDTVDNHFLRIFGSALLMSAITAGVETSVDLEVGRDGEIFRSEAIDQLGEVATELLRKNIRIAPTIEIRPGYRFGVMVNKDIILPPYQPMQTAIRRINP